MKYIVIYVFTSNSNYGGKTTYGEELRNYALRLRARGNDWRG
jgi:hypothetical protein